jgi:hypothetical protein
MRNVWRPQTDELTQEIVELLGYLCCCVWALSGTGQVRADVPSIAVSPESFVLSGKEGGVQLIVSARRPDGRLVDVTHEARYTARPVDVLRISPSGYVRPASPGEATITITAQDQIRMVKVSVREFDDGRPLHFANDIQPILTRYGCNAGGCHGKASGQNGFKLSLFGFDADFDHSAIVKEARGRRVFPAAPEKSLLLTKPAGVAPHGGGRRLEVGSEAYQVLRRWIAQGMPVGSSQAAKLQRLEMVPNERVLDRHGRQQLAVRAHYSDGSIRDVTRHAQFQSNETAVAAINETGLVRALDLAGEAAIMARYRGEVAVFRATVPLGKSIAKYPDFGAANYIDHLMLAKWKQLGLAPSSLCSDSQFTRRVYLDLCGKLPAPSEVKAFLADTAPGKRAKLIDRCLEDRDHAGFFALKWGSILRNSPKVDGSEPATYAFHDWIRDRIARNRPYDEFVRAIITASGEWQDAPAVNWYWQMQTEPVHQAVADSTQVFLGVRVQCARCHHHPFERWSQDDYFGLAGFFDRFGRKAFGPDAGFFPARQSVTGEVHPRTGQPLQPKVLGGSALTVPPEEDPRQQLVNWMVQPDNPFFAKALCNRMWGHFFGRGLVEPLDDLRATNPPSNPELLAALARDFVEHKFDVKHLIRTICNSRTYQLSSEPNEFNQHDRQNHARYYAKRLIAEALHDAVDQACGTKAVFNKVPKEARAVDLPHERFDSYLLDVFDRPIRNSPCECGRGTGASLSQVLHLVNAPEVEDRLASDTGRVARLIQEKATPEKAVEEIYLASLSRSPTDEEKQKALSYLSKQTDQRRGLEDVLWTLINSREFQFNH